MLARCLALLLPVTAFALDAETADAVAVGDCVTALDRIGSATTDDGRLAVGWCTRRTDPGRAVQALDAIAEPELAPYARYLAAQARLNAGEPEAAIQRLEGVELPGALGLAVRLVRARALLAQGKSLQARPDLRALLTTSAADEARFLLAEGARDRGDLEPAITTYLAVWTDSVRGPWAGQALARLEALGHPITPDTRSGRALIERRISSLEGARSYEEALAWLHRLPDVPLLRRARLAARARAHEEAVDLWDQALGPIERADGSADDLFDVALATARTGDYATAARRYQRLISRWPGTKQSVEASYKLGYMPYDAGDCEAAIPAFEAHLAQFPSSPFAASTRWFLGRCHVRQGDPDLARDTWQDLIARAPSDALVPAARYWLARLAGQAGDTDAEAEGLAALLRDHPTSGHAWFAARRLGHTFPTRAAIAPPPWPDELAAHPAVVRARRLLSAGLRSWAALELQAVVPEARRTRQGALAAAHALIAAGAYRDAMALARPYCVAPWQSDGDPVAQQACYPRPEHTLVRRTAAAYGLHPLLPYAIMWSESAMKPEVTSFAGARGLMQVMPSLAETLHPIALGHGPFDADNLYLAPYNALLGTTELGRRAQSLAGVLTPDDLPAVIASYNGGEEAVRRWTVASAAQPVPFDVFAEDISYTQTRRYVRGVLGHLMTYLWVYGDPSADAPGKR